MRTLLEKADLDWISLQLDEISDKLTHDPNVRPGTLEHFVAVLQTKPDSLFF